MIRVCIVDDHPALRAGVWTVIRNEPGMEFAGSASSCDEAVALVERVVPDVVLLDYQLPGEDAMVCCQRMKSLARPPKVVVYSAYSDPALAISALVAGADGMVSKAALADELLDAIRFVARGRRSMPPIPEGLVDATATRLDPDEVPIFSMIVGGTVLADVARELGLSEHELTLRLRVILDKLGVKAPGVRLT